MEVSTSFVNKKDLICHLPNDAEFPPLPPIAKDHTNGRIGSSSGNKQERDQERTGKGGDKRKVAVDTSANVARKNEDVKRREGTRGGWKGGQERGGRASVSVRLRSSPLGATSTCQSGPRPAPINVRISPPVEEKTQEEKSNVRATGSNRRGSVSPSLGRRSPSSGPPTVKCGTTNRSGGAVGSLKTMNSPERLPDLTRSTGREPRTPLAEYMLGSRALPTHGRANQPSTSEKKAAHDLVYPVSRPARRSEATPPTFDLSLGVTEEALSKPCRTSRLHVSSTDIFTGASLDERVDLPMGKRVFANKVHRKINGIQGMQHIFNDYHHAEKRHTGSATKSSASYNILHHDGDS